MEYTKYLPLNSPVLSGFAIKFLPDTSEAESLRVQKYFFHRTSSVMRFFNIQVLAVTLLWAALSLVLCHENEYNEYQEVFHKSRKNEDSQVGTCDTSISTWYNFFQEFLSTGNLSTGLEAKIKCEDDNFIRIYDSCKLNHLPSQLDNSEKVCQILNLTYDIAELWGKTRENRHLLQLAEEEFNASPQFFKSVAWIDIHKIFFENCTILVEKMRELNKIAAEFVKPTFVQDISNSDILRFYRNKYDSYKKFEHRENDYMFYRSNIRFTIVALMTSVGLLGNGAFLLLFACHSELRTSQNILIINLAIADIFHILFNIVFKYVWSIAFDNMLWNFGHQTCRIIVELVYIFFGYSACSVVALSVQRFYVIMMPLQAHSSGKSSSHKCLTFLNVFGVWILAIMLPLPISLQSEISIGSECTINDFRFCTLWTLIWYGVLPSLVVAILYTVGARRLARNKKILPEHADMQRRARNRGAGVLVALTVVFAISYTPPFVYLFLAYWEIIPFSDNDYFILCLFWDLICLNSIFNPIALYVSSKNFREYFKKDFHHFVQYLKKILFYGAQQLRRKPAPHVLTF